MIEQPLDKSGAARHFGTPEFTRPRNEGRSPVLPSMSASRGVRARSASRTGSPASQTAAAPAMPPMVWRASGANIRVAALTRGHADRIPGGRRQGAAIARFSVTRGDYERDVNAVRGPAQRATRQTVRLDFIGFRIVQDLDRSARQVRKAGAPYFSRRIRLEVSFRPPPISCTSL